MNPDPDTMVPVLRARSYKRFLYPKAVTLKEVLSSCSLNLSANLMTLPSTLHPQNPLLGFGGWGGGGGGGGKFFKYTLTCYKWSI